MNEDLKSPMSSFQRLIALCMGLLFCLGFVLVLTRVEVHRRAQWAFEKAEQHRTWVKHPEAKQSYGQQMMKSGLWTRQQYDLAMMDSNIKNARIWYETVVDLYSPPGSAWKNKAELRLREIKELSTP